MSWKNIELAKVCEVFSDGDWIESKDQSDIGIRLIQTGNVGFGRFKARDSKARYISEETFKRLRCTEIKEGDLLVSRLPDPVGRACIIPQLVDKSITAVDCTIIRTKQEILYSNYLNYYCQSPQYFEQVKKNITGATRQRISRSLLGKTLIPLAPIATQQKIVAKLDAIFAEIDTATAAAEANAKNAEALFQNKLHAVFNSSNLDWTETTLESVCKITNGSTPKRDNNDYWENGDISWFTVDDIRKFGRVITETIQHVNQFALDNTSLKLLPVDTVLLCCTASVGEYAINKKPMATNQQFNGLSVTDKNLLPEFLFWYAATMKSLLLSVSGKVTIDFIPISRLKALPIKFPSIEEQYTLIRNFNDLFSHTENVKSLYKKKLIELKNLKNSILQKAFNGELVKD